MTLAAGEVSRLQGRRWHDLDALRGVAMLLGIGLHAALSFYPSAWPVEDVNAAAAGPFDEAVLAIHGFRMPLFFLLSGFFTALLWQRRGLGSLLGHRARRLALPFALGIVLIVPTVDWVADRAVEAQLVDAGDLPAAAYLGYEGAVASLLDGGADPDVKTADGGHTPLYLAAVTGDTGMVESLLAGGADPTVPTADGLAVDAAAYFGHAEVADALVAGGSPDPRPAGSGWQDLPYWALGAGENPSGADEGLLRALPSLHHLWFLWFLVLFVLCFAPVASLAGHRARRLGPDAPPSRLAAWLMWILVPLVLVPQLAMEGGETIPAFGPDTSIGWIPLPAVFAYYLLFFAFGSLLYGRTTASGELVVDRLGRPWWLVLPAAGIVLLLGLRATFDGGEDLRVVAAGLQVAYAWLMIFGLMAVFRALLSAEHRVVRYLSDASYWMYLVHLTLVIGLQAWVRTWDIPAAAKLLLIVLTTCAILLISYRFLVRYTPIGTLLNGKRVRPGATARALRRPIGDGAR